MAQWAKQWTYNYIFLNKSRWEPGNAPRIGIGHRSSLSKVVVKSDIK